VALSTADPSNPRIDVIAVDNNGEIVVIEGTPSATPSVPQIDPATQIELTSVYIPAGSTVPDGVTQEVVYDENTEVWSGSTTGVTGNFNNTTNTFNGSKSA
jgi:hypothetical protein